MKSSKFFYFSTKMLHKRLSSYAQNTDRRTLFVSSTVRSKLFDQQSY